MSFLLLMTRLSLYFYLHKQSAAIWNVTHNRKKNVFFHIRLSSSSPFFVSLTSSLGSPSELYTMETSAQAASEKKECKGSGLDASSFSDLPKKPSPTTLTRGMEAPGYTILIVNWNVYLAWSYWAPYPQYVKMNHFYLNIIVVSLDFPLWCSSCKAL